MVREASDSTWYSLGYVIIVEISSEPGHKGGQNLQLAVTLWNYHKDAPPLELPSIVPYIFRLEKGVPNIEVDVEWGHLRVEGDVGQIAQLLVRLQARREVRIHRIRVVGNSRCAVRSLEARRAVNCVCVVNQDKDKRKLLRSFELRWLRLSSGLRFLGGRWGWGGMRSLGGSLLSLGAAGLAKS